MSWNGRITSEHENGGSRSAPPRIQIRTYDVPHTVRIEFESLCDAVVLTAVQFRTDGSIAFAPGPMTGYIVRATRKPSSGKSIKHYSTLIAVK